jgi:hypothetical protein
MSWKFAGIIFKKDYRGSYPDLLNRLGIKFNQSAEGFTFSDAISRENQATALGFVNDSTLLLHHLIPYDCSYEPGESGRLDGVLEALSLEAEIMNYIIDGVSGTYCFSVFSGGKRIRRWAVEPGKVLCNEGEPVAGEAATITRVKTKLTSSRYGKLSLASHSKNWFKVRLVFLSFFFERGRFSLPSTLPDFLGFWRQSDNYA